jgi:Ca2+-binding EF-hand superfamily protein
MGCTNSKLPDHELEELLKLTYFDEKRLQRGYRCFMGVCPDGKMDLIKFKRFYKGLYPSGDPSQFASYVFKVIDTDDDGYINFKEFICFMSTASLGEVDEQIECK